MIVPTYWAEARAQHADRGKQVTLLRFGWSDTSIADAQAMADARAEDALARHLRGESLPRREHKVAYNGAEGLPIREEILERHGSAVITRNLYGARCLNTPDVLFADVDFDQLRPGLPPVVTWVGLLTMVGVAAYWYGRTIAVMTALIVWLIGFVVTRSKAARLRSTPEQRARAKIDAFIAAHPDWLLRLYRTPAGLRLLAMHRLFDANEPAVTEFFDAVGVDKIYARMCARQRCFRARLTAKPWRIGIVEHLKPRPGVWPIKAEHLPRRAEWVAAYEDRAAGYAACKFIETLGKGRSNIDADRLRELHDELTRATQELPLA